MKKLFALLALALCAAPAFASGNNGTIIGSPTFGTGRFTAYQSLTGVTDSDYISIPQTVVSITSSSSWAIEAWVKTTYSSGIQVFLSLGTGSSTSIWMGINGGKFQGTVGGGQVVSTGNIDDGAWHHCVLEDSAGTTLYVYVDGVLQGSSPTSITSVTGGGQIGRFTLTGGYAWSGSISEVAFWNTEKYTSNFTPATSPYVGIEANLQTLYHLNDNAIDSSAGTSVQTTSLPPGTVGGAYSQTLVASGGVSPYTWSLYSGSLPTGLTLSSSGAISGTPTVTGSSSFVVSATDSNSPASTGYSGTLTITVNAYQTIVPNNSAILYSPYNWNVDSTDAISVNAGAYLRTVCNTTSFALIFAEANLSAPYPEMWARIDGDGWQEYTLSPSNTVWSIASGLQSRKHLVEVIIKSTTQTANRWNVSGGVLPATAVDITGLGIDASGSCTAPTRRTHNILIYGDSITEGVRSVNDTASNDTDQNDVLSDYSYALATATDSEVGVVAFGATGILASSGSNVPALPSSYNYQYQGVSRTFSPAPDLVIYNDGTNDSTTGSTWQTAFETVLAGIHSSAPLAKQLLLVPFGGSHLADIQAIVTAEGSPLITYANTSGWFNYSDSVDGIHPYGYEHLQYIAPQLFPIVEPLLSSGGGSGVTVGTFSAH